MVTARTGITGDTKAALPEGRAVALYVSLGVLLIVVAVELVLAVLHPLGAWRHWGGDYTLYMDATSRWLAGGPFYQPWQLQPYEVSFVPGSLGSTSILYPPYALALFVPFTFLPAVLWWAVPLAVLAFCLRGARGWALVALLLAIAQPVSWWIVANGNPALWCATFLVAATRYPWAGVFVLLKPTLGPLALMGIRTRGWWLGLAGIVALSLVMLPMTIEYVTVLRNATGPYATPLYSLTTLAPLVLLWMAARLQPLKVEQFRYFAIP